MRHPSGRRGGFTLIELAVVLVVIGLVVGGIVVGRDLIAAAGVRSQISQIEHYQRAALTFRGKYEYLPGDLPEPHASNHGFVARGIYPGQGDGNGQIEGIWGIGALLHNGGLQSRGETAVFWVDLSRARLIGETFSLGSNSATYGTVTPTSSPPLSGFFPEAELGAGNYVYVYSDTFWTGTQYSSGGINRFGISAITSMPAGTIPYSGPGLTVAQAHAIDLKVDDGLPQRGNVLAMYLNFSNLSDQAGWIGATGTAATPASSSTCYDNANVAGARQVYSIAQDGGRNVNCVLSFKFQ